MIRCLACGSALDLSRDLLARRFLVGAAQRSLTPADVLLATNGEFLIANDRPFPQFDYSRAVFQHLYGCLSCLAIIRADRPVRADDVVPGRLSLAIDGAVGVRAVRRLTSAAAAGRACDELRALRADPVRRYLLRAPAVFRAARPAFEDEAVLAADVTISELIDEHGGPHGICWDTGPAPHALRRLVKRTVSELESGAGDGTVEILNAPLPAVPYVVRIARGTRLSILGESGATLRVAAPHVTLPEGYERIWRESLGAGELAVPLDLVRPG